MKQRPEMESDLRSAKSIQSQIRGLESDWNQKRSELEIRLTNLRSEMERKEMEYLTKKRSIGSQTIESK